MTVTTLRKISSALCVTADYIINGTSDENESELIALCKTLSPENRQRAVKIIRILLETP